MSDSRSTEIPTVGGYRRAALLTVQQLADKLDISKGYCSDLCTGKERVTENVARKLETLSGIPWHQWMPAPATTEST